MTHDLMTTAEVAETFRVSVGTVNRWAREGKLAAITLPGGIGYRFRRDEVEALLAPAEVAS